VTDAFYGSAAGRPAGDSRFQPDDATGVQVNPTYTDLTARGAEPVPQDLARDAFQPPTNQLSESDYRFNDGLLRYDGYAQGRDVDRYVVGGEPHVADYSRSPVEPFNA